MSKFDAFTLRHASNNVTVQDGLDTYAIRGGGKEVWAATTGENLSRLTVEVDDADVISAARSLMLAAATVPAGAADPVLSVGTTMTSDLVLTADAARNLRLHIDFVAGSGMTPEQVVAYLWDALKMEISQ